MKFSSEPLQIRYMDTLYHTHQYVCDYKLMYIVCVHACFQKLSEVKSRRCLLLEQRLFQLCAVTLEDHASNI